MKLALRLAARADELFSISSTITACRGGEPYPDPQHYFARVVAFMNSPALLGFMREITDLPDIVWADAQATLYPARRFPQRPRRRIRRHISASLPMS
jgi:hypothetical protein